MLKFRRGRCRGGDAEQVQRWCRGGAGLQRCRGGQKGFVLRYKCRGAGAEVQRCRGDAEVVKRGLCLGSAELQVQRWCRGGGVEQEVQRWCRAGAEQVQGRCRQV